MPNFLLNMRISAAQEESGGNTKYTFPSSLVQKKSGIIGFGALSPLPSASFSARSDLTKEPTSRIECIESSALVNLSISSGFACAGASYELCEPRNVVLIPDGTNLSHDRRGGGCPEEEMLRMYKEARFPDGNLVPPPPLLPPLKLVKVAIPAKIAPLLKRDAATAVSTGVPNAIAAPKPSPHPHHDNAAKTTTRVVSHTGGTPTSPEVDFMAEVSAIDDSDTWPAPSLMMLKALSPSFPVLALVSIGTIDADYPSPEIGDLYLTSEARIESSAFLNLSISPDFTCTDASCALSEPVNVALLLDGAHLSLDNRGGGGSGGGSGAPEELLRMYKEARFGDKYALPLPPKVVIPAEFVPVLTLDAADTAAAADDTASSARVPKAKRRVSVRKKESCGMVKSYGRKRSRTFSQKMHGKERSSTGCFVVSPEIADVAVLPST